MDQEDFVETYGFSREELDTLLEGKQYRQLREKINELNEADIAEYLEELSDDKRLLVFRMLQKDLASEVFAFLLDIHREEGKYFTGQILPDAPEGSVQ